MTTVTGGSVSGPTMRNVTVLVASRLPSRSTEANSTVWVSAVFAGGDGSTTVYPT
jgi:hypothetical protein